MLRNFRSVFKGNQTPMAVVMMVVLLGMVAYLAPSQGGNEAPDNVYARVYGRDILKRDVDSATGAMIKRMGKQANLEALLPMIRSQAINQLLQGKLTQELAERHGIVVTEAEVKNDLLGRLKAIPAFLTPEGQIRDTAEINATLREYGTSLKQWEEEVTTNLSVRKLFQQAASRVPVDEPWLNLEHRVRNEKVSFEAYTLAPDPAPVADPGTPKLEAFLKESGARFQAGPRRVLQYVVIDPTFFGPAANDDAAVKAVYEAKKAQYTELKASHILFKAETENQVKEAILKAQALRAKLVAGQDFAKTATELSEDPSAKANKGDLGWFKSGQMVKPFEDAALTLKQGELSQPVRTIHGIHLIRLEGRKERSFEDVKEELRAQVNRERFASKAKDKLEQLRKRAGERGDLTAPSRNLGLKLQTSQPLTDEASSVIEGLAGSQSMANEAFRMEVGQVSKTRQLGDRYVVFRVQEERPSAIPPLAEIRTKVLDAWKLEEARRVAQDKAKAAVKAGDLGVFGAPAAQEAVTITSMGELGKHPAIRKALLDTPAGQLTPVLWSPEGKVWVARIKTRTPAEPLSFEARRKLVEAIQSEVAEKLLTAELRDLDAEGRKHPGLSSFWGRFGGVWINKDAEKRGLEEMPDFGQDLE
jgi:peptidyl-prolyl cis-trans isomerase D